MLQTAAPRRRSFSLPSFRRSSAAERQEVLKDAEEEAARIQKAAAWQWYTRGVGEPVVITPARPPVGNAQAPVSNDKSCISTSGPRSKANVCNISNMPQQKIVEPPLAESPRAASRFKVEAGLRFTRPAASGGAPQAPASLGGRPSTTLYDELELSRLRTHTANFVQRPQHHHTQDDEPSSPAVGDHGRSRPPPPSVSTAHHHTKVPPAVAVASSGDHPLITTLHSSPAPVASIIPFRIRPFSALRKLFRKVLTGSIPKCTKNFSQTIDSAVPAVYERAEVLYNDFDSFSQYHDYHHYIHHHHHHYHFSKSPKEQASIIPSRRRHSESGSSRLCSPSLVEADSDEEEEEEEDEAGLESRIAAYLAGRRRRHSDRFSTYQLRPENADFDKDERMKEEYAKVELPMQFSSWRYNSARVLPSKIPTMVGKDNINAQPAEEDQLDEGTFVGIRHRRRHSAELHREGSSLERTGGNREGGAYKLGGTGAGCGMPASMSLGRR